MKKNKSQKLLEKLRISKKTEVFEITEEEDKYLQSIHNKILARRESRREDFYKQFNKV